MSHRVQTSQNAAAASLTLRRLSIVPMIVALWAVMALAAYWVCYAPSAFETVQQTRISRSGEALRHSEPLLLLRRFCLHRDVRAIVHAEFHDGVIFRVQDTVLALKKGCHESVTSVTLPHSLPAGPYVYRVIFEYKASPLRVRTFALPDVEFQVAAS